MTTEWLKALLGGGLIGLAASLMLVFNGRVMGVSGIIFGSLTSHLKEQSWRLYFLAGLVMGGTLFMQVTPLPISQLQIAIAGILVGFGTILGGGCTSGHGICGMSRLSIRSIIATFTFMVAGFLTVYGLRHFGVLP